MANPLYGQNKADDKLDVIKDTHIVSAYNPIADAADDTTISILESGKEYYFGTATGVPGAADSDNAFTFRLPTPSQAGEKIKLTCLTASAYAKLLGFSCAVPASETIRYIANSNGVFIESGTTVAGVDGTANSMVKINATHFTIGDTYEAVSLSTTVWLLTIKEKSGLLASGDIAPDPGNVAGYID